MTMTVFHSSWLKSRRSALLTSIGVGELCIAAPFFIFFVLEQPRRGPFTAFLALKVAGVSVVAGLLWGIFMWAVFIEPMRKRNLQ